MSTGRDYRGLHVAIDRHLVKDLDYSSREVPTPLGLIIDEYNVEDGGLNVGRLKVPESTDMEARQRTVTWYLDKPDDEGQLWLPNWGPLGYYIRPISETSGVFSTIEGWRQVQDQLNNRNGFTQKLERNLFSQATEILCALGAITLTDSGFRLFTA